MTTEPLAIAEAPDATVDLAVARRYCTHATKQIRAILGQRERIAADAREQLGEITQWRDGEFARYDGEIARLEERMRPMVAALIEADPMGWRPEHPKGRRSVEFPAGRAGFRAVPEHITAFAEKEGEAAGAAAVAWLLENDPSRLRVKHELDLKAIREAYPVALDGRFQAGEGEVIPGLRLERPQPTYWVKPIGGAQP